MNRGQVYIWQPDSGHPLGGTITMEVVGLPRLDGTAESRQRLSGRYVRVRNGGAVNVLATAAGQYRPAAVADAQPDSAGDFVFPPERGGARLDKATTVSEGIRCSYIQAAHFGEVNTYYHIDRIAAYIDGLLQELGATPIPPVTAIVNAHHAAAESDHMRDGVWCGDHWLPFQGGHYRLPSRHYDIPEYEPIAPTGEIHLGPGWQSLRYGALVEYTGRRYRHNAAHNAGILYHEYGHHINRHTADFRANDLRFPDRQTNKKVALDEGCCDYWSAAMLATPHIWSWHRRHDQMERHPRSLASMKTMADYDPSPQADPHQNGTIWAAALWDLRTRLASAEEEGARHTDLLVLQSLLLLGQMCDDAASPAIAAVCRLRRRFATGLVALLQADERLFQSSHRDAILTTFARRSIHADRSATSLVYCLQST